eukprot:31185-Pelagococcus_subviridis.AAC.2
MEMSAATHRSSSLNRSTASPRSAFGVEPSMRTNEGRKRACAPAAAASAPVAGTTPRGSSTSR